MNWQNKLLVGLVVINLCIMVITVSQQAKAADLVTIPYLPSDSKYIVSIKTETNNPITFENKLGLYRGAIESVSTDYLGNITIQFAPNIILDSTKVNILNTIVNKSVSNIEVKK